MAAQLSQNMLLAVPLAPLVGAVVAGFFGKAVGRKGAHTVTILGVLVAFICSALVLMGGFRLTDVPPPDPQLAKLGNTHLLGVEIYTKYLYPVQLAAVLLLVAIIAAIALTLRQRKDSRSQDPSQQVLAKKADRLRVVKMDPVLEQPSLPPAPPAAPAAAGDKA